MYWLVRYAGGSAFRASRRDQTGNRKGCQNCKPESVCQAAADTVAEVREAIAQSEGVRFWTDDTGEHQVEAIFLGLSEGTVKLQRASTGATMTVPLHRLSNDDQQHALKLASR